MDFLRINFWDFRINKHYLLFLKERISILFDRLLLQTRKQQFIA